MPSGRAIFSAWDGRRKIAPKVPQEKAGILKNTEHSQENRHGSNHPPLPPAVLRTVLFNLKRSHPSYSCHGSQQEQVSHALPSSRKSARRPEEQDSSCVFRKLYDIPVRKPVKRKTEKSNWKMS